MDKRPDKIIILLISGRICSGKSSLAKLLVDLYGAEIIKTKKLIIQQCHDMELERDDLQKAGENFDRQDGGLWVGEALQKKIEAQRGNSDSGAGLFVIDSVRIKGQIDGVRKVFPSMTHHIHLTADEKILVERYAERNLATDHNISYNQASANTTESKVEELAKIANLCIKTDKISDRNVLQLVIEYLGQKQ